MKKINSIDWTRKNSIRPAILLAAGILGSFAAGPTVLAQNSDTWTGGGAPDGNWQNPNNWGGSTPVAGDYLFFDTDNQLLATNNYPAGTAFGNLTFNSTAGSFDLSGNSIVLAVPSQDASGNLTGGSITNLSAVAETNALGLTLPDGFHYVVNGGAGPLYLTAPVIRNADATVDFSTNGGIVNLSGSGLTNDASANGGLLGGWAMIGAGNNAGNWATLDVNSNVIAYTGYTPESGSFTTTPGGNFKITQNNSTCKITAASGSDVDMNTLLANPGTSHGETIEAGTAADPIRLGPYGGIMNVNGASETVTIGGGTSYSLTAGGPVANNPGELTLVQIGNNSGNLAINSVIQNNGTGAVSVNEVGSINYDVANTYSGGTHIHYGEAYLQSGASFGSGPIYVYPGARADFGGNNGATVTNSFYISGMGFVSAGQPGAIKGTYTGKFTGTFTLMGDTWIDPNAGSASCTFSGPFTGTGSLSIGGPVGYYVEGTAIFGGNCSFTGDAIVDATSGNNGGAGIEMATGANDILNNGGNLTMVGGSGTSMATFDLNGTTQTINGLMATAGNPENAVVKSSADGGVLVVGNNNASSTYYGVLTNGSGSLGLTKIGSGTVALDWLTLYTGPTIVSNGVLSIGYSLASSQITVAGSGILDVSALGTYNLGSGQTLNGNGSINGSVSAGTGSTLSPGLSAGTLTFSNDLTLNAGSVSSFNLSSTTNGANGQMVVDGDINLYGGTVQVSASTLQVGRYRLIVYSGVENGSAANLSISYAGSQSVSVDDSIAGEIDLVVSPAAVTQLIWNGDGSQNVWDIDTTANWLNGATPSVFTNGTVARFTDSGSKTPPVNISATVQPLSLVVSNNTGTYTLGGNGSIAGGTGITKQGAGALVLNDTGGDSFTGGVLVQGGSLTFSNNNLNISGGLTVSNSTVTLDNYGAIVGNLTVQSGGSVLLDQQSGSTFTGNTIISNNATLQLGNNDSGGVLPAGSMVLNGTLNFNQTSESTVAGSISGSGTLNQNTNNTLILSGTSSFAGNINIFSGTLSSPSASGLGNYASGTITIANGATLDKGADKVKPIIVSGSGVNGAGAIVNSSGNSIYDGGNGGLTPNLTLTGDTTFGGTTRWDLGYPCVLSTGGSNYNLTINEASGTYMEWEGVTIDTNLGNIDIYTTGGGSLGLKGCGASIGNPTNTIAIHTNSALTFWGFGTNDSGYAKNIHVMNGATLSFRPQTANVYYNTTVTFDDGANWDMFNGSGSIGTVLLQPIQLNGLVHLEIGDSTCTVSNVISGTGGFYWDNYNNVLALAGVNTYTGETDIRANLALSLVGGGSIADSTNIILEATGATVNVTKRTDGTLTLAPGQTLNGDGVVVGNLIVGSGATVLPGNATTLGVLTVTNGNVTLSGITSMKLSDTSTTNDVLNATGTGAGITYGGTLWLTNLPGPLAVNDSFKLFNAANYSGSFTAISPATPGAGLAWDTAGLTTSGTLTVVAAGSLPPNITGISLSGATLTLTAANGATNGEFVLLESTNVALPLAQWTPVLTNSYDANGNLNLSTNIVNRNYPQMFYILSQP